MVHLIYCVIWGVIGYIIANEVAKANKQLNINPMLYGIGSFSFGILWCMLFLAYKVYEHKKYNKFLK